MASIEKVQEKILDEKYVLDITKEYYKEENNLSFTFIFPGDPINYVRERAGRGHNHFYNPKEDLMKTIRASAASQISEYNIELAEKYGYDLHTLCNNVIKKAYTTADQKIAYKKLKTSTYYIDMHLDYYMKIPTGDSIKTTILKEKKIIRPAIPPDLDNYDKFIIDAMHNVLYDDDKRIVSIDSCKYYSIQPRTELTVNIQVIDVLMTNEIKE